MHRLQSFQTGRLMSTRSPPVVTPTTVAPRVTLQRWMPNHEQRPGATADLHAAVLLDGTVARVLPVPALQPVPDAARLGRDSRRVVPFPVPAPGGALGQHPGGRRL